MVRKVIRVLVVLLVLLAGFMFTINRGMGEIKKMKIGEINLGAIADGIYQGSFTGGRWSDTVEVTVKEHKTTDIRIIAGDQQNIIADVIQRVKETQSLQIDAVPRASVTTKAVLKSVENALSGNAR